MYFQLLLDGKHRFDAGKLLHFLPAMLSILVKGTVQVMESERSYFGNAPWGDFLFYAVPVLVAVTGLLMILIYFLLILFKLRVILVVQSKKKDNLISNLILVTVAAGLAILLLASLSLVTGKYLLFKMGISLLSLHVIAWFLLGQKYPEFSSRVVKEVKTERYRRSLISGIDVNLLESRLLDLMKEDKLFRDEELSLNSLADHLSITPHQLSEFLNSNRQMNFKAFVNSYRIEDAKEMLIREPERSILSVAYNTGFNTKSTFYNAFSKAEGITPMEYRKNNLPEK